MTDRLTLEYIVAEQRAVEIDAHGNGRGEPDEVRAVTVRMADIVAENVRWLWPDRIPLGKVTIIEGDPGLGKSTFSLDVAARLSTGQPTPDGHPIEPATTIIMTAEDGLADTIRPRLEAAGADCSRVIAITGVESDRHADLMILPAHLLALRQAVDEHDAKLVIIDPLVAFLGGEVNTWRDHDIRRALRPLAELAEETGAAVVLIRHLTKGTGRAIYRGGGSIGIAGAARSVLLVAKDPDDEGRRVLASTKSNLSAEVPSLAFRVEDDGYGRPRVSWDGTSHHRADALVAPPEEPETKTALSEAKDLLLEHLGDGPCPVKEVEEAAKEAGVSKATLRRARHQLGVRSSPDGFGGPRMLHLPSRQAHNRTSLGSGVHAPGMSETDSTEGLDR